MWKRRQPQDKEVLLAVALSQSPVRRRRPLAKRREIHGGRECRYRLCDEAGSELGEFVSTDLLEPGDLIHTNDPSTVRVVAVAPVGDESVDFVALVEPATDA